LDRSPFTAYHLSLEGKGAKRFIYLPKDWPHIDLAQVALSRLAVVL
jgi:hypothetical protein